MSSNKNKQSKEELNKMKTEFAEEIGVNMPDYNNYSGAQGSNVRNKSNTKKNYKNQSQNQNQNQ